MLTLILNRNKCTYISALYMYITHNVSCTTWDSSYYCCAWQSCFQGLMHIQWQALRWSVCACQHCHTNLNADISSPALQTTFNTMSRVQVADLCMLQTQQAEPNMHCSGVLCLLPHIWQQVNFHQGYQPHEQKWAASHFCCSIACNHRYVMFLPGITCNAKESVMDQDAW